MNALTIAQPVVPLSLRAGRALPELVRTQSPPAPAVPPRHDYTPFYNKPPTCQTGIEGLSYDFNNGARIQVPAGNWRVKIIDREEHMMLYETQVSDALITSNKKYYIPFRLEIFRDDRPVFTHDFAPDGQKVFFQFPKVKVLGDTIASFPYVEAFRQKHNCEAYCAIEPEFADLFRAAYPDIQFVGWDEQPDGMYATYYVGYFKPCHERIFHPVDWRITGLPKTIGLTLGLGAQEIRPCIVPQKRERTIPEPYVCIATQATSQAKYWNNPMGWIQTIEYLKAKGYRVLCIDKEMCQGKGAAWNTIPYGAENFTGALPLAARVELLQHADFFIGLSSGLSWLAWAVGVPVVMLSGFSLPLCEFENPYRIINYHTCNGCFSDSGIEFDNADFLWCPRLKNTDRQFECTRYITHERVREVIDRLMRDYNLQPG